MALATLVAMLTNFLHVTSFFQHGQSVIQKSYQLEVSVMQKFSELWDLALVKMCLDIEGYIQTQKSL